MRIEPHPLQVLVPLALALEIPRLEERGGPDDADRAFVAEYSASRELASRGDLLLYGGKPGEAAKSFANLVRALAILAFMPGGVKFDGHRYVGRPA